MARRWSENPRLVVVVVVVVVQSGFCFQYLFHHGLHCTVQIQYRMESLALRCAMDSVIPNRYRSEEACRH